jgi:hypothetical protein
MGWKNVILKKENKIGFIILNRPVESIFSYPAGNGSSTPGEEMSLDNSMAFESAMTSVSLMSPEAARRLKAFLEKKK